MEPFRLLILNIRAEILDYGHDNAGLSCFELFRRFRDCSIARPPCIHWLIAEERRGAWMRFFCPTGLQGVPRREFGVLDPSVFWLAVLYIVVLDIYSST
jgi:hypothetical protein